jgi:hypothetical protein
MTGFIGCFPKNGVNPGLTGTNLNRRAQRLLFVLAWEDQRAGGGVIFTEVLSNSATSLPPHFPGVIELFSTVT